MFALVSCGGGGTGRATRPAATGTTTTSSAVAPSTTASIQGGPAVTPAPGAQGAASARGGATPPKQSSAGGSPAASGPKAATPVPAGRYVYDTNGTTRAANGPPRPMPSSTTLVVDHPQGPQQHTVRDLRDQDGVGTVTDQI